MSMHDIPISVLDELTPIDIEKYLAYLSYYEKKDGQAITNGEKGKSRKLSAIRTMYNYYFKKEFIKTNAPSMIETPKKHKDNIIRLDKEVHFLPGSLLLIRKQNTVTLRFSRSCWEPVSVYQNAWVWT